MTIISPRPPRPDEPLLSALLRGRDWVRSVQAHDLSKVRGRFRRFWLKIVRVLLLVARLDVVRRLQLHAQALTYDTLLAFVPLLAVMFAVVNGFGGLDEIRQRLQDIVLANISTSDEVRVAVGEYLQRLLGNIRTGTFSAVSVVILVYSVLSLLGHIESAINTIFGSKTVRPWLGRVTTYWAALTLGPLLLGASLALTAALQTSRVASFLDTLGLGALALRLLPLVVTWTAFTAMYLVIPTTRVRVSGAIFAAVVAGSSWNLAKFLYADYAKGAITVQNIYGSLAAVPLFILWIYVSWLLVLLGAQLAFAYQHASTYHNEELARAASQRYRERVACRVFLEIARDFYHGRAPTDPDALAAELDVPRRLLESVIADLASGGFVREVGDAGALSPGRDLASVSVADIVALFRSGLGVELEMRDDLARRELEGVLDEADRALDRHAGTISFRDLAERLAERPTALAHGSSAPVA